MKTLTLKKEQAWVAWALLFTLALIWGSSFILIKRGLVVYSAGEVGALRLLSAGLFLLPVSLPKLRKMSRKELTMLFISGLVGSFFPAFLFAKAQTQLASGLTGVLNALTPLFVLIIGFSFFKQPIKRESTLGLIIGFIGTAVLIFAGAGGNLGHINEYAFLVMLATLCYGINVNLIKHYLHDIRPLVITAVSLLFMGIISSAYLLAGTDFVQKVGAGAAAFQALSYIVVLGVVGTALALIIFNQMVKTVSPLFASSVTYLIPIVAMIWGVWDGEALHMGHFIGMCTILAGVYLANRKK